MPKSLRWRLLAVMIAIPVLALVSVGAAVTYFNRDRIEHGLQFNVLPATRSGSVPRDNTEEGGASPNPAFDQKTTLPGNVRVFYDAETGQGYLVHTEPGFLTAYRKDRENVVDALNKQLAIAIAAVAVLATLAAIALSRRIVKPVESLTRAARQMEAGNLSERVHSTSRDEIGELANAFNAMASSLERNQTLRKTITSDIAHELRTPLNNVSGYLDAIADGVVAPDSRTIASLQEEAQLLVRLVADLEQLSIADSGYQHLVFEETDLNELVGRVVEMVAARATAKGVTVRSESRQGLPPAHADPARLAQVIRNLLENAVTHTPAGGSVEVKVSATNGRINMTVSDTGPGIPKEHLPNIFERFYRADPSRNRQTGGAGLGLAIVKQLVEAHAGTVGGENLPGGGSRFTVTLPGSASVVAAAGPASGGASRAATQRPAVN
ncbi:MAG: ATP-binding protein [Tepidiformaceae bacterium]